jgi:hypothetical protein
MKYDDEYNSYKFNVRDMEIILDALSYAHWNDKSLSTSDRDYIDGLYQSLENSYSDSKVSV